MCSWHDCPFSKYNSQPKAEREQRQASNISITIFDCSGASAAELDALAANTRISMNADDDRECSGFSLWMEPCAFDPNDIFNNVNHLNVIRDSMNYILL